MTLDHDRARDSTPDDIDARAEVLFRRKCDGVPFQISDVRDLLILDEADEEPRVIAYAGAYRALVNLGGDDFAEEVTHVELPPGYVRVVIRVGSRLTLRLLWLRQLQRGGQA